MKVIVSDTAAFDGFHKRLIGTTGLTEVTSYFTMETIKETTHYQFRTWIDTKIQGNNF